MRKNWKYYQAFSSQIFMPYQQHSKQIINIIYEYSRNGPKKRTNRSLLKSKLIYIFLGLDHTPCSEKFFPKYLLTPTRKWSATNNTHFYQRKFYTSISHMILTKAELQSCKFTLIDERRNSQNQQHPYK